MLGVNLGEDPQAVLAFRDEFGVPFPLLLDPDEHAQKALGVRGHPSTALIDRKGRIRGRILGERDWQSEAARRLVRFLLESED
jgi:cytochrome c biogenesis protein CcmG, thiol:disulfide interchange protein DsbE